MSGNSTSEHEFVKRLTKIVEANLPNEQFGVNELAAKTGMSRSQIHRRLKSISNKSVSQFIREVRLEKAKELLEEGILTGSEIAFKVGFGSPSYFIKSFHDYFGYPPGEVKKAFLYR
jgi:AraC-like DNA-binding protein